MEPTTTPQPGVPASEHLLLQQYLAERDVPCPACGYNIRQLQGNTCPECGRELRLTLSVVGLSNTWITALVAALVPAACGLPFQIILFIAFVSGELFSGMDEPIIWVLIALVLYSLGCWVITILLLTMRKKFMRKRSDTQRVLASALVFAAVIAAVTILGIIASL